MNKHQIAADAAREIYGADMVKHNPGGVEATAAYAIIKSAIEKAIYLSRPTTRTPARLRKLRVRGLS